MTRREPRRRGRRQALTDERMAVILDLTEKGNYLSVAAAMAGIGESTLHKWLSIARDARHAAEHPDPDTGRTTPIPDDIRRYVDFLGEMERAHAHAEAHAVETIHKVIHGGFVVEETTRVLPDGGEETTTKKAPPDGRLALEYLARRDPARWGRTPTQRVEITGAEGGAVQVESSSSVATLVERLAAIAALPQAVPVASDAVEARYEEADVVDAEVVD